MKVWKSLIQREVKKMQRRKQREEDGNKRCLFSLFFVFCFYLWLFLALFYFQLPVWTFKMLS